MLQYVSALLADRNRRRFTVLKDDMSVLLKLHSRLLLRSDYGPPPVSNIMNSPQEVKFTNLPVEVTSLAELVVQLTQFYH
jgi:hypothetical protein